jgi:phosphoglycerate dehydrogenase-like enzyme
MPFLCWIHSITAGVEHLLCPEIIDNPDITLTNARTVFSHSLAEYVILSCLYFAKDLPRMMKSQVEHKWDKFKVRDIRGATMGIIGYGDIGRECARVAKTFNMKTIGLRKNPDLSEHDRLVDEVCPSLSLFHFLFFLCLCFNICFL